MRKVRVNFTTDTGGGATAYGSSVVGRCYSIQLIDGDLADGVDVTITTENADLSIPLFVKADFNTDQMVYPRVAESLITNGSALTTYALPILFGRTKVVVAQGGSVKTGAIVLYVLDA